MTGGCGGVWSGGWGGDRPAGFFIPRWARVLALCRAPVFYRPATGRHPAPPGRYHTRCNNTANSNPNHTSILHPKPKCITLYILGSWHLRLDLQQPLRHRKLTRYVLKNGQADAQSIYHYPTTMTGEWKTKIQE